jgi:hypothetical protein
MPKQKQSKIDITNLSEEEKKALNKGTHINTDKNASFLFNLPKTLKAELEREAEYESRTLTNYIISILKKRKKPEME